MGCLKGCATRAARALLWAHSQGAPRAGNRQEPGGDMMIKGPWLYRERDVPKGRAPKAPPLGPREVLLSDWFNPPHTHTHTHAHPPIPSASPARRVPLRGGAPPRRGRQAAASRVDVAGGGVPPLDRGPCGAPPREHARARRPNRAMDCPERAVVCKRCAWPGRAIARPQHADGPLPTPRPAGRLAPCHGLHEAIACPRHRMARPHHEMACPACHMAFPHHRMACPHNAMTCPKAPRRFRDGPSPPPPPRTHRQPLHSLACPHRPSCVSSMHVDLLCAALCH